MPVAALAALSLLAAPAKLATLEIYPSDDIWVYPHASEPDTDPLLRVWGLDGQSVAPSVAEAESFGYSFLRFDLGGLPAKELKGATLVLTHVPNPTFTFEQAKANPLEARPVNAGFTEKKWAYGDLANFMPKAGKEAIYGTGVPEAFDPEKSFPIKIDLLKGPGGFAKAFEAARKPGAIAIALTSTLAPNEEARSTYKLCSKDGDKSTRPVLRLEFAD